MAMIIHQTQLLAADLQVSSPHEHPFSWANFNQSSNPLWAVNLHVPSSKGQLFL